MPRHPRLFIPGATYHVYCRIARGEFVFDDDFEAIEFVETLREVRDHGEAVEEYLDWIRSVAEARWEATGVIDLPWWSSAQHVDEIATIEQDPEVQTFDGQRLAEERAGKRAWHVEVISFRPCYPYLK